MSKPDPNDKRRRHVASVVRGVRFRGLVGYLRTEFPDYDVVPFPAE